MATDDKNCVLDKWDSRFLSLAKYISTWSKDPSTQVGAVIARGNRNRTRGGRRK
jgi:deoxycytidylate deaminase